MADPHRLLSDVSDADDIERELLESLRKLEPPGSAKGEAWARLSVQIAAVGLASAAPASAAASSSAAPSSAGSTLGFAPLVTKGLGGKLTVGLALSACALGTSALWVAFRPSSSAAVANATAPSIRASAPAPAAPALASVAPVANIATGAAVEPDPAPSSVPVFERPSRPGTEANPSDRLSAESALLTQARAQLRRGDAAAAAQSLARLQRNFPRGMLGQEREVLAIEVLAAQGNLEAARRRARAFMATHPHSPHSPQLSRFADAP